MADVLGRVARAMRGLAARLGVAAPGEAASRTAARVPGVRADRDRQSRYCRASGWRLRASCTDLDGDTICPLCSRSVRTHPDQAVRHAVQVIPDHVA
jgi:hypothetical protein